MYSVRSCPKRCYRGYYKLMWEVIKVVCRRGREGNVTCRCIHRRTLGTDGLWHGHVPTNIALWLALTYDGVTYSVMVSLCAPDRRGMRCCSASMHSYDILTSFAMVCSVLCNRSCK